MGHRAIRTLSDVELATLARDPDPERAGAAGDATAELWRRYYRTVQRAGCGTDGADVATDAFFGALRSFPHAARHADLTFASWWRRRARWLAARRGRIAVREVVMHPLPDVPAAEHLVDELITRRERIISGLQSLTPKQRRVLALCAEGFSSPEVGELEELSPEAVRSIAARARRNFREAYFGYGRSVGLF